ncbi:dienelactone hydrolase family protein [Sphingomonas glacialis]|uniref:Dienelactone hydrolase family protein n=1 Tax=Sphingomonas glacialis TaxID=658225 RepID=A0A502FSW9_9SPHN|nr:dienelactone hydrolase family protein [Sphingomonas glacialis]TPG52628.1 dienelactone hydrolase family protein [Sphingomonas glacialis]
MGEQIEIVTTDGRFAAYRALPSVPSAPAVVVLHELFGVNADMRQTCDDLAARGFLAICPDLFWRQQPGIDLDVRSEADWKTGLALYGAFDRELGVSDIIATVDAAAALTGSSGRVGILGYCLGGLMTFLTAARTSIDAAVAFHGAETEKYLDEAGAITTLMLMHLAGEDEFMPEDARNAIITALDDKPNVQVFTYSGCHHAFSRHGGAHYDARAATLANQRTWSFFTAMLGRQAAPFSQRQQLGVLS